MSNYEAFPIYDMTSGLHLDKEPWLIPKDAFSVAENVYFYQGRVFKRNGYERFITGTPTWKLAFDGGANEPDVGDLIKTTTETTGAVLTAYTKSAGAWDGTATGFLWVQKATLPGYVDNEDLINDTQSETLAGDGGDDGPGVNGTTASHGITQVTVPPVMGIFTHHTTGGANELLVFDKDYAYLYNATTDVLEGLGGWSTSTPDFTGADDNYFWVETWQDQTFFVNNVDQIKYWNSSSLQILDPTFGADHIQTCLLLFVHKGHLIAFNTQEAGIRYPQRARISNTGSYTTWTDDLYVDADTVDWITGVSLIRGELLVFFERSIWWLRYIADATNPFAWERILDTEGCYSTHSVTNFQDEVIGLGATTWVGTDGIAAYDIAEKVPDLILTMNPNKLNYAYGFTVEEMRQYLCSYPSQGQSYPDKLFVLNYLENSFSLYSIPLHTMGYWSQQSSWTFDDILVTMDEMTWTFDEKDRVAGYPLTLMGLRDGYVYNLFVGSSDNSVPISTELCTKELLPYQDKKAKLGYIDIIGKSGTIIELTVSVYKDEQFVPFLVQTISMTCSTSDRVRKRMRVMEKGKSFRVEISDSNLSNPWVLDAIIPYFKQAGNIV